MSFEDKNSDVAGLRMFPRKWRRRFIYFCYNGMETSRQGWQAKATRVKARGVQGLL